MRLDKGFFAERIVRTLQTLEVTYLLKVPNYAFVRARLGTWRPSIRAQGIFPKAEAVYTNSGHLWGDRLLSLEGRRVAALEAEGGLELDTLAVLPYGRWALFDAGIQVAGPRVFEAVARVAAAGRRIAVGRAAEREIEFYEPAPVAAVAGRPAGSAAAADPSRAWAPATLVRWDGPDRTVTEADADAYRQAEWERTLRTRSADPVWYRRAGEAIVSEKRLVADRFPAHGAIRIATTGEIWVREYERPRAEDDGWLVFAPDGRLECRAFLPFARRWDLFEIGPGHVLGRVRDELDVEHVRRYPLATPASTNLFRSGRSGSWTS